MAFADVARLVPKRKLHLVLRSHNAHLNNKISACIGSLYASLWQSRLKKPTEIYVDARICALYACKFCMMRPSPSQLVCKFGSTSSRWNCRKALVFDVDATKLRTQCALVVLPRRHLHGTEDASNHARHCLLTALLADNDYGRLPFASFSAWYSTDRSAQQL